MAAGGRVKMIDERDLVAFEAIADEVLQRWSPYPLRVSPRAARLAETVRVLVAEVRLLRAQIHSLEKER